MKFPDVVLLSFSIVFLVIAAYEIIRFGLAHAYWSLMISVVCFFAYTYRKRDKVH